MKSICSIFVFVFSMLPAGAQDIVITGMVSSLGVPVPGATLTLAGTRFGSISDSLGNFIIDAVPKGRYTLKVTALGFEGFEKHIYSFSGDTIWVLLSLTTESTLLNEVVVTGVSKATRIRENPIPVASVSTAQIEQGAESNLVDVLAKNIPGLTVVKTGSNISKPFIRGLGYNRVLTLYDGIRQEGQQWGDEHGIEIDAYNMGRVEVIKGPASLMYGSDALAGVVSFIPAVATGGIQKLSGKYITEYQTNNRLLGNGLRVDYGHGNFLFGVRGSYRRATNYRNPVDGPVYLTAFSEKNLSFLAGRRSEKGYSNLNFTLYDNRQAIPDGSRDSVTRKFTYQVFEGDEDDIKNRPLVSQQMLISHKIPVLSQHIQHYRLYHQSNYQVGGGGIQVLFGLQQNIRREYNHPTMPQQPGMHVRLNVLNYGVRYNAPKYGNLESTVGVNGMIQTNKSLHATDFPIPDYRLAEGGMYIHSKWKKNKWTASGGIRYDLRRISWDDFYTATDSRTGFATHVALPDAPGAELLFPAYRKLFHGLTASAGATLQVNSRISLKANIGRAYRAPNINEMAANGLDPGAHMIYLGNRNFNPEFSLQEDIGLIARFKDLSADLSLFNNHIQNYIYLSLVTGNDGQAIVDAQGNRTYQYIQSVAQLYGGEFWLAVHPAAVQGFRFDNSLSTVYGFNRSAENRGKKTDGEYLPLIPPFKLLSAVSQTIKPGRRDHLSLTPKLELEYAGAQKRYFGVNNTETYTPSYVLFNIGISSATSFGGKHDLSFHLQVNNLLDRAYQSGLSRLKYFEHYASSPNGRTGIYNMGRNISFKVILPF